MSIRTFKPPKTKQKRGLMADLALSLDPVSAAAQIEAGFDSGFVGVVVTKSKIKPQLVGRAIGVNRATFNRHEKGLRWEGSTAVRVYMGARLLDAALSLFDNDKDRAEAWLEKPSMALGGVSPLDYAKKPLGQEAVIDLIGKIRNGVIV